LHKIKNIIFDLGGVILDINYQATVDAFAKLGISNFSKLYSQKSQQMLFNQFETGHISSEEFIMGIKQMHPAQITDEHIIAAWNAMLKGVKKKKLDYIKSLRNQYHTILLSNTNEIHISFFEKEMSDNQMLNHFKSCFEKIYYSSRMGLRKPHSICFEKVLSEQQFNSKETLFIDDSTQHIKGAKNCGINAVLFPQNGIIQDWLPDIIQSEHR